MDWINQSHLKYQARRIHGTGGLFRWGSYQAHFDLSHEDNSPVHTHWMISTTLKPLWKWMRLCISRGLSINTLLRVRRYLRGTPFAVPRWDTGCKSNRVFHEGADNSTQRYHRHCLKYSCLSVGIYRAHLYWTWWTTWEELQRRMFTLKGSAVYIYLRICQCLWFQFNVVYIFIYFMY